MTKNLKLELTHQKFEKQIFDFLKSRKIRLSRECRTEIENLIARSNPSKRPVTAASFKRIFSQACLLVENSPDYSDWKENFAEIKSPLRKKLEKLLGIKTKKPALKKESEEQKELLPVTEKMIDILISHAASIKVSLRRGPAKIILEALSMTKPRQDQILKELRLDRAIRKPVLIKNLAFQIRTGEITDFFKPEKKEVQKTDFKNVAARLARKGQAISAAAKEIAEKTRLKEEDISKRLNELAFDPNMRNGEREATLHAIAKVWKIEVSFLSLQIDNIRRAMAA